VNDLDEALLMLLVRLSDGESAENLFADMQTRYDARPSDNELGPLYKIGPLYSYRAEKFAQVQTFAGSLIMRVVVDVRKGKFERPVIFRHSSEEPFISLTPGCPEVQMHEADLIKAS
jgi:hypothetical protein